MKKTLLASGAITLLFALTSCNLENSDSDNYLSVPYPAINLVIPQDGNAFAAADYYTLVYYPFSATVTINSQALSLGVGNAPFTTSPIPYTAAAFTNEAGVGVFEVTKFNGGTGTYNGTYISNLSGYTSQLVKLLPETVPDFPMYPYNANVKNSALVMNYTANHDYNVFTFSGDAVYSGTTSVVSLDGTTAPYSNNETLYRVIFHTDLKQADVLFCNAKFNERMPSNRINFLIKNLDVTFKKNGYSINMPADTDEIVPLYFEGGSFTPYEMYRFKRFNFDSYTSSHLTEAQINFDLNMMTGENVAARYNCSFNGSYVVDGPSKN